MSFDFTRERFGVRSIVDYFADCHTRFLKLPSVRLQFQIDEAERALGIVHDVETASSGAVRFVPGKGFLRRNGCLLYVDIDDVGFIPFGRRRPAFYSDLERLRGDVSVQV